MWVFLFILFNIGDAVVTYVGIEWGLVKEVNPLYTSLAKQLTLEGALLLKVGVSCLFAGVMYKRRGMVRVLALGMLAILVWNIGNIWYAGAV